MLNDCKTAARQAVRTVDEQKSGPFETAFLARSIAFWRDVVLTRLSVSTEPEEQFELRFGSLFDKGRALAFPCDSSGRVDIDQLSDRARNNYYLARSSIGREFACPDVRRR